MMIYKLKAQIQAELVGMAEDIFVTSLDDVDVDFESEDEDEWLLDDMDPEDDCLAICCFTSLGICPINVR